MNKEKLTKWLVIDALVIFDVALVWYTIATQDLLPLASAFISSALAISALRVFGGFKK